MALLLGNKAMAQVSLSDFKVDDATAIKVYTTVSTRRQATFTVKLSRPSTSSDNPSIRVNLVGGRSGFPEQEVNGGTTITSQTPWTFSTGSNLVSTVTGRIYADYDGVRYGNYSSLQAVTICCGSFNPVSRSNLVSISVITNPTIPAAITITNFTVDNATSVNINSSSRTVTYRLTLSKDPGYTDEFVVNVRGANSSNALSPVVSQATFQTQSSGWSVSGTQRVYSVTRSFPLSVADVGANDVRLVVQAVSPQNFLLGVGANTVALNRVVNPIPCISDVYVQNVSSFSGTKSSGQDLYAGRAVTTSTANGDVIVRNGATAAFLARGSVALVDGFSVEPGATFSASQDASVCSSLQAEEPVEVARARAAQAVLTPSMMRSAAPANLPSREAVAVYPNPTKDELNVQLLETGNARELRIFNNQGREVKRVSLPAGQTKVDVRLLEPGIYYLHTNHGQQSVKTRFSVER